MGGDRLERGHEVPVGRPGGVQLLGPLLQLLAQLQHGLLELGGSAPQLLGVVQPAHAAGVEDLLAGAGQPVERVQDALAAAGESRRRAAASAAGLSDSGLYAHFRKQGLYQALMREAGPQTALPSSDAAPDGQTTTSRHERSS